MFLIFLSLSHFKCRVMCSLTYRFKQQILKSVIVNLGHRLYSPSYSRNQTLATLYILYRLIQNISSLPSLCRAEVLLSSCPSKGSTVVEWIWLDLVLGAVFSQRPSTVALIYYDINRLWIKQVRKSSQKTTIDIYQAEQKTIQVVKKVKTYQTQEI